MVLTEGFDSDITIFGSTNNIKTAMKSKDIGYVSWKVAPDLYNIKANDRFYLKCVKCDDIFPVWKCTNCGHSKFQANEPDRYNDGSCFVKCQKCEAEWGSWNHTDCGANNKYSVSLLYAYDQVKYNSMKSEEWLKLYIEWETSTALKWGMGIFATIGILIGYMMSEQQRGNETWPYLFSGLMIGIGIGGIIGLRRGKTAGTERFNKNKKFYRPTSKYDLRQFND